MNDNISFGSDASIDAFQAKTVAFWISLDVLRFYTLVAKQDAGSPYTKGWDFRNRGAGVSYRLTFSDKQYATGEGEWDPTPGVTLGRQHLALTWDGSSPTNDPVFYVDGVAYAPSAVDINPSGAWTGDDAAHNLIIGGGGEGDGNVDGQMCCFVYHDAVGSAADLNRARWWGRPFGGLKVYHPFWTDKLANEGTATANGTATGTTVAAFAVPTVRPGFALMGCGVGW